MSILATTCKYGHDSARYKSGACIECSREHSRRQRNAPGFKERKKQYFKTYSEKPENKKADSIRHARWRSTDKGKRSVRAYYLKATYGITVDEYEKMAADQGRRCAICGSPESGELRGLLCVDHDHTTGAIRELLCNACNVALGNFDDDPVRMEKGAAYLRLHGKG